MAWQRLRTVSPFPPSPLSPLSHRRRGGNASGGVLSHCSCRHTDPLTGMVSRRPQREHHLTRLMDDKVGEAPPTMVEGRQRDDDQREYNLLILIRNIVSLLIVL